MEAQGLLAHILWGLCYWVMILLIAMWTGVDTVAHIEEHFALLAPYWQSGKLLGIKGSSLSKNRPLVLKAGYLFWESL